MKQIEAELLDRLKTRLQLSQSRVYALIDQKVRTAHLPRRLAAIALAAERGINISRFASPEDLAEMRQAGNRSPAVSLADLPPVSPATTSKATRVKKRSAKRGPGSNTVFVVHGRDGQLREAMFAFLRSIALKPFEWNQVIRMTGQASPYIGTILDTAFREAAVVVVLLTPDDEAQLKRAFWTPRDKIEEKKLTGQPRPNVLFEAGMALGRNPDSTVLVQIGEVRQFSDVAGRHLVHMTNDTGARQELAIKLRTAGAAVDLDGRDWMNAGDFSFPLDAGRSKNRRKVRGKESRSK
jgi:predicted nucleotide-binding protein